MYLDLIYLPHNFSTRVLQLGADPSLRTVCGTLALHYFCGNSFPSEGGREAGWRDEGGKAGLEWDLNLVLHALMPPGRVEVNSTNRSGETPLHYAARTACDPHIVRFLVRHGADLSAKNVCRCSHGHCSFFPPPSFFLSVPPPFSFTTIILLALFSTVILFALFSTIILLGLYYSVGFFF